MHSTHYSGNFPPYQPDSTAARVLSRLALFDLKKDPHPGRYRGNYPLRGSGASSYEFTIIIEDDEHGLFHTDDFKLFGTLRDLAERLHVETRPRRAPDGDMHRTFGGLADYAQAHGVPVHVFTAAEWKQTTHRGRLALVIPTQNGIRYRYLDGRYPMYHNPTTYKRCWYKLEEAVQLAGQTGQSLIVCNREATTLVAQYFGLPACSIAGLYDHKLSAKLINDLKAAYIDTVLISYNALEMGGSAASLLMQQLHTVRMDARIIDLKMGKGGDLVGLCREYGQNVVPIFKKLAEPEVEDTSTEQPTEPPPVQIIAPAAPVEQAALPVAAPEAPIAAPTVQTAPAITPPVEQPILPAPAVESKRPASAPITKRRSALPALAILVLILGLVGVVLLRGQRSGSYRYAK